MTETLSRILFSPAAPDAAVFIETADGRSLSFGAFRAEAARYAGALSACGVKPGDRVLVQVEKSVEALALYAASILSGAVFVPANTAYTLPELERFAADAEPALVVVAPARLAGLRARLPGVAVEALGADGSGTLAALAASRAADFAPVAAAPGDLAAILYTSGTTGRSKGAMLTQANLASNALSLVDAWTFTNRDVLLHALPIYHTHGLFVATNVALLAGARLVFLPKFDLAEVKAALPRCTTMMGVPTFYTRLLSDDWLSRQTVGHMRLFISGSAPLLSETHEAFAARTGHHILERYGMTETSMNTSNPYEGERRAGTVGFPLPGVELRIAAEQGGIGMIEIRGPNVFAGYWRDPIKTAEEFTEDGFFRTGDLGRIDPDGYLHIVGRSKDLIISGGLNIYPKEVEIALNAQDGVADSAVIGVPHRDLGEGVVALVVPAPDARLDPAGLIEAIRAELAGFKLPKRVVLVKELPRNAMGKVQKNLLREEYATLLG